MSTATERVRLDPEVKALGPMPTSTRRAIHQFPELGFDAKLRQELPGRIERIARGLASGFGAEVEAAYEFGDPTTVNDAALTDLPRAAAATVVGVPGS